MRANVTGVVLAGGKSSRFGSEKALAALGGRSLLLRATEALCPFVSDIAISAARSSVVDAEARRLGFPVLPDRVGLARGPLAGILAGLEWSEGRDAEWMISLPCDVVCLPSDTFSRLLAAAAKAGGAYAVTAQGPQSLCAVWPVGSRIALETALNAGAHPPVREFVSLIGGTQVHFEGSGIFLNINTKDDLLAAEKAQSYEEE
jgi:molybdopterin-guanine dinucleotide biosynthesis protein A